MRSKYSRVLADGVAWGLLLWLLASGVPRVESVFTDYGVPLPRLTDLTIRASHWRSTFLVLATILLSTVMYGAAEARRDGDCESSRSWSMLRIAIPLLLITLTLTALVLPWPTIDTGLSG